MNQRYLDQDESTTVARIRLSLRARNRTTPTIKSSRLIDRHPGIATKTHWMIRSGEGSVNDHYPSNMGAAHQSTLAKTDSNNIYMPSTQEVGRTISSIYLPGTSPDRTRFRAERY
ncbi:hypothetical protein PM082_008786 [Marasmius tenuissimus]|nr:hypothetical protein PM082_008786 [Marasmius tenuissimus]